MKPRHLPEVCPGCRAALSGYAWHGKHAHGWDIESARYACQSRRHFNGREELIEMCPRSPEADHKQARAEAINRAVAKALTDMKCTEAECWEMAREMDAQKYTDASRRLGIWRMIKMEPAP